MQCISIPECTQRLSDHYIGGQHGQESEEGEEGEERSEEDCEEDQEGFQEEEVTRLEENAGGLMPATSQEPSAKFASRSEFKPETLVDEEGVGETSGQTAGSIISKGLAPSQTGPAEETSFLPSCGYFGPRFHRRLPLS